MARDDEGGGSGGLGFIGGMLRGLVISVAVLAGLSLVWPVSEGVGPSGEDPAARGAAESGGDGRGARLLPAPEPGAPEEPEEPQETAAAPPAETPSAAEDDAGELPEPPAGDRAARGTAAEPSGERADAPPELALAGPALSVNAAPFEAPPDQPILSVILRDPGPGAIEPETLLSLAMPLTVAVAPGGERASALALEAARSGYEVVAEIPIAAGPAAAGGPAIRPGMSDLEIAEETRRILARLDTAVAATGRPEEGAVIDERTLRGMLAVLGQHGFGMIGRGGEADVVAAAVAGAMSVRYADPGARLGAEADAEAVYAALDEAAARARTTGTAVISVPGTLPALQGLQRWALEKSGREARLAPLSAVLRRAAG
jgi:hypothetical protein